MPDVETIGASSLPRVKNQPSPAATSSPIAPMASQFGFFGTAATTDPETDVTEVSETGRAPETGAGAATGIAIELIEVVSPDLTSSRSPLSSLYTSIAD